MRAAVIVAHPDDETMYCGGTIARFRSWHWDVVCAAHRLDSPRGREFAEACKNLGASPIMLDVRYGGKHAVQPIDRDEVRAKLTAAVDFGRYQLILTHNARGEYGQRDHMAVHEAVRGVASCPVLTFGFNEPRYDVSIHLDPESRRAKALALACYQSQKDRIVLVEIPLAEHFLLTWP